MTLDCRSALSLVLVVLLAAASCLAGPTVGGRVDDLFEPENEDDMKELKEEVLPKVLDYIDTGKNATITGYKPMVVEIKRAEGIMVAGYCYYVELVVGESKCKSGKGKMSAGNRCSEERKGGVRKTYYVGVWYKNWAPDAIRIKTNARTFDEIKC